jgi:hypothetical protein
VGRIGSNRALQTEQVWQGSKGQTRKAQVSKGFCVHQLEQMYERRVIKLLPGNAYKI